MSDISSFVFFDIETTGLPFQENNRTKITDISLIAALRQDIENTENGIPLVSKLTYVINPEKKISRRSSEITGLTNKLLKYAPTFKQKINTLTAFLEDLPKPVCLVAHNGNRFDFKILLAECQDANIALPEDLLCIDSLIGFQYILKHSEALNNISMKNCVTSNTRRDDNDSTYNISNMTQLDIIDLLTDDEDEWPELNVSAEDFDEIDNISTTVQAEQKKVKISYKLIDLYEKLLNKKAVNAHRAESDCLILLECVVATKKYFLPWAQSNNKKLCNIEPLRRY